tara:strand:+ start:1420 stop:1959 length:540 start_codon:yes stop_codon:yes gene_type:complete
MDKLSQAKMLAKSRFIPKEFRDREEDIFFMLDFVEKLGGDVSLLQALNGVYFNKNNEPHMKAHLLLALINNEKISNFKGGVRWRVEHQDGDMIVTAVINYGGENKTETLRLSDAKTCYNNKLWNAHPEYLLKLKTVTLLTRLWASQIFGGLYTEEEDLDINGIKDTSDYNTVHNLLNNK